MKEAIRMFSGMIIGYIEDNGSRKIAYDEVGRVLGYYNKSGNTTTDFYGRILYYYDMLPALVAESWNKRH